MTTRIYQGANQARGDGRRLQCRLVGLRCATPDPVLLIMNPDFLVTQSDRSADLYWVVACILPADSVFGLQSFARISSARIVQFRFPDLACARWVWVDRVPASLFCRVRVAGGRVPSRSAGSFGDHPGATGRGRHFGLVQCLSTEAAWSGGRIHSLCGCLHRRLRKSRSIATRVRPLHQPANDAGHLLPQCAARPSASADCQTPFLSSNLCSIIGRRGLQYQLRRWSGSRCAGNSSLGPQNERRLFMSSGFRARTSGPTL